MPTGTYRGRLVADGNGNLLADEGEHAGHPVYHDLETGQYVFAQPGEESHNERHHQQFVDVLSTVDQSMTDDESLVNADSTENPHHFEVQEDDPHFDEGAPNKTRIRHDPDRVAATATGHTDAYTGGSAE